MGLGTEPAAKVHALDQNSPRDPFSLQADAPERAGQVYFNEYEYLKNINQKEHDLLYQPSTSLV